MYASVITIGDEILVGQIVDTNAAYISQSLGNIGITVRERVSVGDTADEIRRALDRELSLSEIVVMTGGLGPTKDDVTKRTLAAYFGCGMVRHQPTYDMVREMLLRRGIEFSELNRRQADVPECCTVLPNRNGTAPGMWFDRDGKVIVSLAGVPFEMKALMDEQVVPLLKEKFRLRSNVHRTMITFGIAESILAERIEAWENSLPEWLHLAYLPSPSGIKLRLSAYEKDAEPARRRIDDCFSELEKIIPEYVVGYDDCTLVDSVARLLTEKHATLAAAESCTGGRIAAQIVEKDGASRFFLCGVVSYSNASKVNVLGVDAMDIERYGAVSRQVAEQMAEGVRRISGADYAVSTTGIAGPTGGSEDKPVGTVWIAVATPSGATARRMCYGRLREQNIERASASALDMLRRILSGTFSETGSEVLI